MQNLRKQGLHTKFGGQGGDGAGEEGPCSGRRGEWVEVRREARLW